MVDNFQIRSIPACPQPLSLQVSNISSDSATASWTAGGSETLWNFQWGLSGFSPGSGFGNTTSVTNFTMSPLSPSSTNHNVINIKYRFPFLFFLGFIISNSFSHVTTQLLHILHDLIIMTGADDWVTTPIF